MKMTITTLVALVLALTTLSGRAASAPAAAPATQVKTDIPTTGPQVGKAPAPTPADRKTSATLAPAGQAAAAKDAKPAAPDAKVKSKANDLDTTINLSLNNANIDQLVKFLSDTTGKPVVKHKSANCQVNLSSPVPVTKRRAMDLIYDALLLDGVYIVEQDSQIQILPVDALKGLALKTYGDGNDIQAEPDSFALAQKIYKLVNVSAEDLKNQLARFIPENVISHDPKMNTLVLTDQVTRLKRYDQIIKALDATNSSDRVIEIFKLKHADTVALSTLIGKILSQTASGGGGDGRSRGGGMSPEMLMAMSGGRSFSASSTPASSVSAGDVTLVAEPSLNWLIVSCPKRRLEEVRKLVDEFDKEQPQNVQARLIDIKHIDVSAVSNAISQLFPESSNKAEKDQIRVVPTDDGNRIIVMSSEENYQQIRNLILNLDTEQSEQKETHTYPVKHLEAQDLADQLEKLYEEKERDNPYDGWFFWSSGNQQRSTTKPSFVPSPRTNTLMVMAKPKDFAFIERMIKELDIAVDATNLEPRIYAIRHTDANELVNVLMTLFKSGNAGRNNNNDFMWRWRSQASSKDQGALEAMFGEIRFVVDNVTNRIVALSSNPKDYEIIDKMIKQLDTVDPESTEVLTYKLKYADALDIADRLNNLFSDGAVQQPNQAQAQQQTTGSKSKNGEDEEESTQKIQEAVRQVVYPWQSGGREQRKDGEKERPINTMIGNVRVVPDIRSNKILVAAPSIYFPSVRSVIQDLDKPEPQVHISTRIIEVQHGKDKRIGIRWTPDPNSIDPAELENAVTGLGQLGFLNAFGGGNNVSKISTENVLPDGVTRNIDTIVKPGNTILGADVNLTLLVQLLVKNSDARIVSEPKLTINNNETGNIFVGSEYPFRTNSQVTDVGSVTYGVEYRKVGINLDIKPHINDQGEVVLQAALENSKVREGEMVDGQIIKDVREFNTEVEVESGQTMVIGGIITENKSHIDRHVPILGSIPGLKYIFGKQDNASLVRELVFFITPEVLRDRKQDDKILKDTNARLSEFDQLDGKDGNSGQDQKKKK